MGTPGQSLLHSLSFWLAVAFIGGCYGDVHLWTLKLCCAQGDVSLVHLNQTPPFQVHCRKWTFIDPHCVMVEVLPVLRGATTQIPV